MEVFAGLLLAFMSIAGLDHTDAARILGVFPTPSKSHWILGSALLKELALDGHEVTDVSPFKLAKPPANYHHVEIETDYEFFNQKVEQLFSDTEKSQVRKMIEMYTAVNYFSNSTLSAPAVKKLLQSNQQFDLVILEIFLDHALLGFAEHFGCPVIGTTTHGVLEWINSLVGTPQPLSYVPHVHIGFSNPMNFWQRMGNVLFTAVDELLLSVLVYPEQDRLYREAFPNATRSLNEMRRNAVSLVLVNNHFSLNYPRPYVPNMIEIGGFHVNRKVNPLPKNIQNFIDNSTDGVIYFSMGSNLKPSNMGKEKQQALVNAFSKVKQNVIWKWDDESLNLDQSKYLIAKWLPQDDILAHPNVKLFITHGGLLSCTESIYHGKPIIGIPVFGDQQMNMDQAVKAGWGVSVKFVDLDEKFISDALEEVLNNDRYTKTVQVISKRLRDQPLPPMDLAKYWVNYVLRHDGAEHLKSPGQRFSFIQYHNIDVYLFVVIIVAILVAIPIKVVSVLCFRSRVGSQKASNKSKKKQVLMKHSSKQTVSARASCYRIFFHHTLRLSGIGDNGSSNLTTIMFRRLGFAVLINCLLLSLCPSNGAKILGVLPSAGWSHYAIGEGIMKALSRAGHEVTVIGSHSWKDAPDNYRSVQIEELIFDKGGSTPDLFQYRNDPYLNVLYLLYTFIGPSLSEVILTHPKVKTLMGSDEQFDVVIVECFVSDVLYGFAQHFKAPLVVFSPFGSSMWVNDLVGTPYPYSQIPHTFLSYTDRMTFSERFINTILWNVDRFYYRNIFLPLQEEMYNAYFPNATQSLSQVMRNVSLAFLNQHFSLSYPHPYAPNMIEIGGIQMDEPKSLPKDIQRVLDDSKHDVIYFSMGSMLKGCNFPEEKRNAFLEAFSELNETVIWKYENTSLPNKPKNVFIRKWMPQSDVLAHPKVKLFITHGGLLGSTESLHHGKPMVGVPIYGDQRLNMARAEKAGYGAQIEYENLSKETICHAIHKVLDNPSYSMNAKLISERFRDKPMTPAQLVVYWVNYVVRHRGAPQLRSAAVDLSFVEQNLLDVYGVIMLLSGTVLACVYKVFGTALRLVGLLPRSGNVDKNKRD
ncbi:uncharacterized protein LOC134209418 [Armigeres subalbatus]|uniref:uncharacterized protein LOC134209418 n=1 Tax=Armigeres subalbatus TaxID=124917 RepID=UPI002ECFC138